MPPPLLVVLPVVILAAGLLVHALRRRAPVAQYGLGLGLVVACFPALGIAPPGRGLAATGLRVMTLNVHFDSREMPRVRDYLRAQSIDVLMVQENRGAPVAYLQRELPHWHVYAHASHAILSRYPIVSTAEEPLKSFPTRSIISVVLDVKGQRVRVLTTHLTAPQMARSTTQMLHAGRAKRTELSQLLAVMKGSSLPTILGADFNNPPAHGFTRALSQRFENCFSARGSGPGWTYPAISPIIRIDHLYVTNGIATQRTWVGPDLGSDHRPVIAVVNLGPPRTKRSRDVSR